MPQPPELAAVVRRANFDLGRADFCFVSVDCQNGLLLFTSYVHLEPTIRTVRCPLYPARYMTILPPTPETKVTNYEEEILIIGGDDILQFFLLGLGSKGRQTIADVYVLQDANRAIYSSVVSDLQIRIWLHRMDSNGVANWFLLNTICLHEICANHMIPLPCHVFEDVDDSILEVHATGFNSEFAFIQVDNAIYFFDIKRKAAKKVYELTREDKYLYSVSTFMMVWPPKFPVMKDEGCDLLKE
ncbi:hypothetical protein VPH35_125842 [Triticum aestivum]